MTPNGQLSRHSIRLAVPGDYHRPCAATSNGRGPSNPAAGGCVRGEQATLRRIECEDQAEDGQMLVGGEPLHTGGRKPLREESASRTGRSITPVLQAHDDKLLSHMFLPFKSGGIRTQQLLMLRHPTLRIPVTFRTNRYTSRTDQMPLREQGGAHPQGPWRTGDIGHPFCSEVLRQRHPPIRLAPFHGGIGERSPIVHGRRSLVRAVVEVFIQGQMA